MYDDNSGIKIVPKKGNAVLFYNLLDDGNGDDLSLHAALPVKEGNIIIIIIIIKLNVT